MKDSVSNKNCLQCLNFEWGSVEGMCSVYKRPVIKGFGFAKKCKHFECEPDFKNCNVAELKFITNKKLKGWGNGKNK